LAVILVYGFASLAQAQATKAAAAATVVASGGQGLVSVLWAVFALLALVVLVGGAVALVVIARRRGIGLTGLLAAILGPAKTAPVQPAPGVAPMPAAAVQVLIIDGGGGGLPDWLAELVASPGWQGKGEGGATWTEE
jgi:hypothetical protein